MKFDRTNCHDKKKKKSGDNIWGLLRLLHETDELLYSSNYIRKSTECKGLKFYPALRCLGSVGKPTS
jgi:hypothetical protein